MTQLSDWLVLTNFFLLGFVTWISYRHMASQRLPIRWDIVLLLCYIVFTLVTMIEIWWSVTTATSPAVSWFEFFGRDQKETAP